MIQALVEEDTEERKRLARWKRVRSFPVTQHRNWRLPCALIAISSAMRVDSGHELRIKAAEAIL